MPAEPRQSRRTISIYRRRHHITNAGVEVEQGEDPFVLASFDCERGVLDNQNETREPGTLFIEREDKCLGDGG
jgi:hypothetical protein